MPACRAKTCRASGDASVSRREDEERFALAHEASQELTSSEKRLSVSKDWKASSPTAPTPPLAIVAKVKNALRLIALDERAEELGLAEDMSLADARAMIPALAVSDDDPAADAMLLEAIADWAERYTPLVGHDDRGLLLDITGCAHLFGGEQALLADLHERLLAQGFRIYAAIADTLGAAWAASRYGDSAIMAPGDNAAALIPLPLAALRLDADTVSALHRVGLKRIGQIIDAPRAPLAARFGATLIRRLDQALGMDEEAIDPRRPPPSFIAERRFAEPIAREEDIAATLASLAATLSASLERHGEGARRLEYALFRVDGVVMRVTVGATRPIRAPKLILALFREKFAALGDDIDAGFGFDMARLSVTVSSAVDAVQEDLTGEIDATDGADALIDRIVARLGEESIAAIVTHATHIPERAAVITAGADRSSTADALPSDRPRPLRLFAHPEPVVATAEVPDGPPVQFRWRRAIYHVARAEGPERIAAEWWDTVGLTRDYFRIEDDAGRRFWLYRDGLFSETAAPQWYVHGIFA
ncbi:MAG TPA: DNA polymerase Y family protein [Bauldia sp.]|nr:DNA polymerase Y family protein [Bauldia sp.]